MADRTESWWHGLIAGLPARTAKLGVTRLDGTPLVVPVWIDLDGEDVVFTTSAESVKGRSILRTGVVSLCVDDDRPPFRFVTINGTTTTSTDPAELLKWATRIGGRYMGAEKAAAVGARNSGAPMMLVRVRPTSVIARSGLAA